MVTATCASRSCAGPRNKQKRRRENCNPSLTNSYTITHHGFCYFARWRYAQIALRQIHSTSRQRSTDFHRGIPWRAAVARRSVGQSERWSCALQVCSVRSYLMFQVLTYFQTCQSGNPKCPPIQNQGRNAFRTNGKHITLPRRLQITSFQSSITRYVPHS